MFHMYVDLLQPTDLRKRFMENRIVQRHFRASNKEINKQRITFLSSCNFLKEYPHTD